MNGEGYRDPTADRAIRNATHLPRQIWSVVKAVREVLNVSHLELVEIKCETGQPEENTNGRGDLNGINRYTYRNWHNCRSDSWYKMV